MAGLPATKFTEDGIALHQLRKARAKVRNLKIQSDRERTRNFKEIDELLEQVQVYLENSRLSK